MIGSFINPVITKASALGVSLFEETDPIKLWQSSSEAEVETVIRAVYRQVLGNAHVMESERLTIPESHLRSGEISVRDFVREVALSEMYLSRFYYNCPRYRSLELNFKHLLGRAPESYEEMCNHSNIWDEGGWQAEIDSYVDSEEYHEAFGENRVPFYRGYKTQTGKRVVGFTHIFQLLRGAASSDKSSFVGTRSRLNRAIVTDKPSVMIPLSSSYGGPTDVNKLLADVLNLKQPAIAPSTNLPKIYTESEEIAQSWQGQYQSWEDPEPVELWPRRSEAEVETVIRAVYRQVLGNAHVMESERLTVPESQIKLGEISVREFVRQVAKSELYRSRFFDNCPRYRAIELNFKHLLGRAPDDYSETFYHSSVLDAGGFEAEIDSYIDSDEYQEAFGENVVPFYRGYKTQTGKRLLGFTNMFGLLPSVSTSDKAGLSGNQPRLNRALIYNHPTGKAPVTDINALLAEVLKPKIQPQEIISKAELARKQAYQALQSQCSEQETAIATLQQQLAELRATATIGAAQLNKWSFGGSYTNGGMGVTYGQQPTVTAAPPESYEALQQRYAADQETIASLRLKIADQQRLAAIGSARLNKWRTRSFS